jgi:hypothetical protein
MKASKLLAMLAFAGLCGTAETQARSHKFEIKHLEKQRAELLEVHREARERLDELSSHVTLGVSVEAEDLEGEDEVAATFGSQTVFAHEPQVSKAQIPNLNWQVKDSELVRARELAEIRMREAAREIARIDKAIRKQRARERRS